MKKALVVLLALMFIGSLSFAQMQAADTTKQAPAAEAKKSMTEEAKTFIGKIVSVTVADPAKGIAKGGVTVVDDMGKTATFTVDSTAKVIDTTLNVVTLNQLKEGQKVTVEHSKTKEGQEEAEAIKVVQ